MEIFQIKMTVDDVILTLTTSRNPDQILRNIRLEMDLKYLPYKNIFYYEILFNLIGVGVGCNIVHSILSTNAGLL